MREILFRGKRIDNGEWVYGNLNILNGCVYHIVPLQVYIHTSGIPASEFYDVDPDTISEFTGLTDKNGKKVFEGDIVKFDYDPEIGFIEFTRCAYYLRGLNNEYLYQVGCLKPDFWSKYFTVVGNIYDNPELLNLEAKA